MAQVKLTLRPPPNVDFVHGYPGISSGGVDRPQAAVKGAIEVRVSPQGIKAKWVRVELRKVETLPGGGPANTFYDFVGPSPVNLWQSSEDYALLQTQDFHFNIRIPESVPPSIALENRAGIKYELVATVCTLGKKGFLRSRKSTVVSTMAPIIIDKHELHSTWPIYNQPESRHIAQDGVDLIVDRTQACFGPGDRVSVMATLKSDSLNNVILRGFELYLKESVIYRAGHAAVRKGTQQAKQQIIGEHRFLVNVTLYGGTQHKAELFCDISPSHTTTSLNTARHIDVTYILTVKALMGTGTHLSMDLPIIISNWPRAVSMEAVRRIGVAPSLSLTPHPLPQEISQANNTTAPVPPSKMVMHNPPSRIPSAPVNMPIRQSTDFGGSSVGAFGRAQSASATGTAPARVSSVPSQGGMDELGFRRQTSLLAEGGGPTPARQSTVGSVAPSGTGVGLRPRSAGNGSARPLTVINHDRPSWPSAEEEKRALYDKARAEADRTQKAAQSLAVVEENERVPSPPPPQPQPSSTAAGSQSIAQAPAPARTTAWPTAEEEKMRLFNEAQAMAARTQQAGYTAKPPSQMRQDSTYGSGAGGSGISAPLSPGAKSAGALLYSQAMAATNKPTPQREGSGYFPPMGSGFQGGSATTTVNPPARPAVAPKMTVPYYPTAEEEKAALKRYHEAKVAVDRTQGTDFSSSEAGSSSQVASYTSYSSPPPLATALAGGSSSYSPSSPSDLPPPFEPTAEQPSYLNEKERLRRAYAAQDAAAAQAAASPQSPPAFMSSGQMNGYVNGASSQGGSSSPPPAFAPPPAGQMPAPGPALPEKEILRRKYEAQDSEGMAVGSGSAPAPPPPRNANGRQQPRAPPVPPASSSVVRTAAEEKALLRAKYEAEDRQQQAQAEQAQRQQQNPQRQDSYIQPPPRPPPPQASGSASGSGYNDYLISVAGVGAGGSSSGISNASGSTNSSPAVPPPLAPRPPTHYIQETQEEDARLSRYIGHDMPAHYMPDSGLDRSYGGGYGYENGFGGKGGSGPPPPPLPPKLPVNN